MDPLELEELEELGEDVPLLREFLREQGLGLQEVDRIVETPSFRSRAWSIIKKYGAQFGTPLATYELGKLRQKIAHEEKQAIDDLVEELDEKTGLPIGKGKKLYDELDELDDEIIEELAHEIEKPIDSLVHKQPGVRHGQEKSFRRGLDPLDRIFKPRPRYNEPVRISDMEGQLIIQNPVQPQAPMASGRYKDRKLYYGRKRGNYKRQFGVDKDQQLTHEQRHKFGSNPQSFTHVRNIISLPGMSKRHYHTIPDQIMCKHTVVYRGTIDEKSWGDEGTPASSAPTWTAHTGAPNVNGKGFVFNLNSAKFPLAACPQGTNLHTSSAINVEPRGWNHWNTKYQYYRLEGQEIKFSIWVNNPDDASIDDDKWLQVFHRRYLSADGDPFVIENEDTLDAWSATNGVDQNDITRIFEEKSAVVENIDTTSRRNGKVPKKHTFIMKYSRNMFNNAAAKFGEAAFDNPGDDKLAFLFSRFFTTQAHDTGHREPAHYVVQQFYAAIRGGASAGTDAIDGDEGQLNSADAVVKNGIGNSTIHFSISVQSSVRYHDPILIDN